MQVLDQRISQQRLVEMQEAETHQHLLLTVQIKHLDYLDHNKAVAVVVMVDLAD
jgi:hypothetical protein